MSLKKKPRISRITRIFVYQEEDQYRRSRFIKNQLQGPRINTNEHSAASGRNQKTWNYETRERPRKMKKNRGFHGLRGFLFTTNLHFDIGCSLFDIRYSTAVRLLIPCYPGHLHPVLLVSCSPVLSRLLYSVFYSRYRDTWHRLERCCVKGKRK